MCQEVSKCVSSGYQKIHSKRYHTGPCCNFKIEPLNLPGFTFVGQHEEDWYKMTVREQVKDDPDKYFVDIGTDCRESIMTYNGSWMRSTRSGTLMRLKEMKGRFLKKHWTTAKDQMGRWKFLSCGIMNQIPGNQWRFLQRMTLTTQ